MRISELKRIAEKIINGITSEVYCRFLKSTFVFVLGAVFCPYCVTGGTYPSTCIFTS